MDKSKILDWLEYGGKLVTWISSCVRSFPAKQEKKESGNE